MKIRLIVIYQMKDNKIKNILAKNISNSVDDIYILQ